MCSSRLGVLWEQGVGGFQFYIIVSLTSTTVPGTVSGIHMLVLKSDNFSLEFGEEKNEDLIFMLC